MSGVSGEDAGDGLRVARILFAARALRTFAFGVPRWRWLSTWSDGA